METYNETGVIHYPTLKTVLMVERIIREADLAIDREEIKRRLPAKIMHQTLNLILRYLEDRGLILDSHRGIVWIYNLSPKMRNALENAREI
ncbi:MAG: hypothetical protein AABX66_01995 [Nanoarchaeota archaeon]